MRAEEAKGGIGKEEVSLLVTTVDDIPGVIEQLCASMTNRSPICGARSPPI